MFVLRVCLYFALRFIQFEVVIGKGGSCETADSNEDVLLQYSTNAGITWKLVTVLRYNLFRSSTLFFQNLPIGSRTNSTRFRWWQSQHSGSCCDHWAIDDVFIGVYPVSNGPQYLSNVFLTLCTLGRQT